MAQPRTLSQDRFYAISSNIFTSWLAGEARAVASIEDPDERFHLLTKVAIVAVEAAAAFETAYCSEE